MTDRGTVPGSAVPLAGQVLEDHGDVAHVEFLPSIDAAAPVTTVAKGRKESETESDGKLSQKDVEANDIVTPSLHEVEKAYIVDDFTNPDEAATEFNKHGDPIIRNGRCPQLYTKGRVLMRTRMIQVPTCPATLYRCETTKTLLSRSVHLFWALASQPLHPC